MAVFLPLCSNYNLGYDENQLVNLLQDQDNKYVDNIDDNDRVFIKWYIFVCLFFVLFSTTVLWFIC